MVDNGLHEVYVNTAVKDGSEVSELMQCFLQTEVDSAKFPKLSKRIRLLKNSEEGVTSMRSVSDELRDEGRIEVISRMLGKFSLEDIIGLGYDREFVTAIANGELEVVD